MAENNLNELIDKRMEEQFKKMILKYQQTSGFSARKLTDTPTDSFQVVSQAYVTLNGTSANRPTSSILGQFYFDTSLASGRGKPIWWNGTGFVDATGSYV